MPQVLDGIAVFFYCAITNIFSHFIIHGELMEMISLLQN